MNLIENVSRRHFLGTTLTTGAFVLAAQVLPKSAFAQDPGVRTRAQGAPLNPSAQRNRFSSVFAVSPASSKVFMTTSV